MGRHVNQMAGGGNQRPQNIGGIIRPPGLGGSFDSVDVEVIASGVLGIQAEGVLDQFDNLIGPRMGRVGLIVI
jgi:hypothetical protein